MALQIITKKRFENKVIKLLNYLETNWDDAVAINFKILLLQKLDLLAKQPEIGAEVNVLKNIRSILITKHNKVYYRIENNKIVVINMIDTRKNPKHNPFNKQQ
jgi:plasmid stabilization system protein ParE